MEGEGEARGLPMWRDAGRVVESGRLLVPISVYSGFLERPCSRKEYNFQH